MSLRLHDTHLQDAKAAQEGTLRHMREVRASEHFAQSKTADFALGK